MEKIFRTVQFYRMQTFNLDGTPHADQGIVWRRLEKMPLTRDEKDPEGPCRIEMIGSNFQAVKCAAKGKAAWGEFYRARYDDLPEKRNLKEETKDLDLDDDEALDSKVHFSWWNLSHLPAEPNAPAHPVSILLLESSFQAPRYKALSNYLQMQFMNDFSIEIEPVLDDEVMRKLLASPLLRKLEVWMGRSKRQLDNAEKTGIMGLWFDAPLECQEIEVRYKPARRRTLSTHDVARKIEALLQMDEIERIRVELEDGQILDLLENKLRYDVQVERKTPKSRSIASESIYREMRNVWRNQRNDVARLLGRKWVDDGT